MRGGGCLLVFILYPLIYVYVYLFFSQEAQIIRFSLGMAISLTFNTTQTSEKLHSKPPAKSSLR